MPDRSTLKIGDRIRVIAIPAADLRQRDDERRRGLIDAGWTADAIQLIISARLVVTITHLDEYGIPWFDCDLRPFGDPSTMHSIAIMDDDSWEFAPTSA